PGEGARGNPSLATSLWSPTQRSAGGVTPARPAPSPAPLAAEETVGRNLREQNRRERSPQLRRDTALRIAVRAGRRGNARRGRMADARLRAVALHGDRR